MRAQFNPFDLYLGTSAGAQNSRRLSAISPVTRAKSSCAIHKTRIFRSIALCPWRKSYRSDWLVEATASQMPLQMDTAARCLTAANRFICAPVVRMTTRQLLFTNQTKLAGCDSRLQCDPGFYRSGVSLEGINYLDGGIVMRFRLKRRQGRALKRWSSSHCAVTNVLHAAVVQTHGTLLGDSSLQPLVNLVQHHETSYVTFSNLLRNHRASCGYSKFTTEAIT